MLLFLVRGSSIKVIKRARGATLLVDEAYQLTPEDSPRDFGPEAVETIMKTIEGDSLTTDDRPAYTFAGYPQEMQTFLNINEATTIHIHKWHAFYLKWQKGIIFNYACRKRLLQNY